ncbi:tail fiber protein [Paraburkholderia sp. BCC1876]|uniref:phage tail protein n=1 Tax=Paraburkholderia sp. BCC1876 TaxID=2676303 RepID=UPI0015925DD4|nr:tail fiber protein [Paraburkholderia sp. BCC1876]
MSDPYLGEIRMVAFDFAPYGWALCQGQLLPLSQNQALFSLLGTLYGGTGTSTFGLPNLASRSPVGTGQGAGLTQIVTGQSSGLEQFTMTSAQLPTHTHPAVLPAATLTAAVSVPASTATTGGVEAPGPTTVLGEVVAGGRAATMYNPAAPDTSLKPFNVTVPFPQTTVPIGVAGSGLPVPLRNPYLGLNFCIALQGIFPTRG